MFVFVATAAELCSFRTRCPQDLSIGKRGEDFETAFAADIAELRQMNR